MFFITLEYDTKTFQTLLHKRIAFFYGASSVLAMATVSERKEKQHGQGEHEHTAQTNQPVHNSAVEMM